MGKSGIHRVTTAWVCDEQSCVLTRFATDSAMCIKNFMFDMGVRVFSAGLYSVR